MVQHFIEEEFDLLDHGLAIGFVKLEQARIWHDILEFARRKPLTGEMFDKLLPTGFLQQTTRLCFQPLRLQNAIRVGGTHEQIIGCTSIQEITQTTG